MAEDFGDGIDVRAERQQHHRARMACRVERHLLPYPGLFSPVPPGFANAYPKIIVTSSFILPLIFPTAMTPVLPDGYFFPDVHFSRDEVRNILIFAAGLHHSQD